MLPSGWLDVGQNTNGAPVSKTLPAPYVATYVDSTRRGTPSSIISEAVGAADVALSHTTSQFTVSLRMTGTYGVVLLDRIQ